MNDKPLTHEVSANQRGDLTSTTGKAIGKNEVQAAHDDFRFKMFKFNCASLNRETFVADHQLIRERAMWLITENSFHQTGEVLRLIRHSAAFGSYGLRAKTDPNLGVEHHVWIMMDFSNGAATADELTGFTVPKLSIIHNFGPGQAAPADEALRDEQAAGEPFQMKGSDESMAKWHMSLGEDSVYPEEVLHQVLAAYPVPVMGIIIRDYWTHIYRREIDNVAIRCWMNGLRQLCHKYNLIIVDLERGSACFYDREFDGKIGMYETKSMRCVIEKQRYKDLPSNMLGEFLLSDGVKKPYRGTSPVEGAAN